jgi:hypothetical protein
MDIKEIENIYKLIIDTNVSEEDKISGIRATYNFEDLMKEVQDVELYNFIDTQFYLKEIGKKIENWASRGLIELNKKTRD